MSKDFKRVTDSWSAGCREDRPRAEEVPANLIGVYRLIEAQGCTEELCRAGMFHSIYGKERFRGFTLAPERRPEARALIGERAEQLASCWGDRPR